MKFDLDSKRGKIKLLICLAIPIMTIGFLITFFTLQSADQPKAESAKKEAKVSAKVDPSPSPEDVSKKEKKTSVQTLSKEEKEASKAIAEKFAVAYGNYDSKNPLNFVQNAKPYMSEWFNTQWEENPPRRPLALSKSTVKKFDTYRVDGGDQHIIAWSVVLTEETINALGDKITQEEWLWIGLVKENGLWKVNEVDISNG